MEMAYNQDFITSQFSDILLMTLHQQQILKLMKPKIDKKIKHLVNYSPTYMGGLGMVGRIVKNLKTPYTYSGTPRETTLLI